MILKEFDSNREAVINPSDIVHRIEGFPKIGISCFADNLIESMISQYEHRIIATRGTNGIPIYEINYNGLSVAVFLSGVGAPACVGGLEELIVMGLEKVILFGTCGVLEKSISDCSIIIPNWAIRDEGTSYHYMAASDEVEVNDYYSEELIRILEAQKHRYTIGKVWTTDALYRETRDKVKRRKEQGAICVDMECSAVAALANHRQVKVLHFFYAADNLDGHKWDKRSLGNDVSLKAKEKITDIALEVAASIYHLE